MQQWNFPTYGQLVLRWEVRVQPPFRYLGVTLAVWPRDATPPPDLRCQDECGRKVGSTSLVLQLS